MWMSTKGRYGIKAAIELSRCYGEGPVSVRKLAKRAGISATYLEQLIKKLREHGIVESVRGAHGGYKLKAMPCEIPVGRVFRALEGSVAPMLCAEEGFSCNNADACVEASLYKRIRKSIDSVIDEISLQDLLDEEAQMNQKKVIFPCRDENMEDQRGKETNIHGSRRNDKDQAGRTGCDDAISDTALRESIRHLPGVARCESGA